MAAHVPPHELWAIRKILRIFFDKRTKQKMAFVSWMPTPLPVLDVDEDLVQKFLKKKKAPPAAKEFRVILTELLKEQPDAARVMTRDLEDVLPNVVVGVKGIRCEPDGDSVKVTWAEGHMGVSFVRSKILSWLNVRKIQGFAVTSNSGAYTIRKKVPNLATGIVTVPSAKLVFNAPYDDKHTYHIKIVNSSARRIGWAIKTTNMKRLVVDPACGVLDPKESTSISVSCAAFAYDQEDTNNDRITIEWTNTPDGATKQFNTEWFEGRCFRKSLAILYNP